MAETLHLSDVLLFSGIVSVLRLLLKGISKNTSDYANDDLEEKGFSLRMGIHHWLRSSSNYHRVDKDESIKSNQSKKIGPKFRPLLKCFFPRDLRSDLSFSFRGDLDRWMRCSLRFRESLRRRERYRPRSLRSWSTDVSCVAGWLISKKKVLYWFIIYIWFIYEYSYDVYVICIYIYMLYIV